MITSYLQVSFIITNWNHKDLLYECIFSICRTVGGISHEIIVVDNASTDGSEDYIPRSFPEVIWIQNETNLGYAKAVNQGVERSVGEFLFLLNNDIVLRENATQLLLSFFRDYPDAGAVAPPPLLPRRKAPDFLQAIPHSIGNRP